MKTIQRLWRIPGLYLLPAALIAWLFYTDVDGGASTLAMLTNFAVGILVVTLAHLARKYVFAYIKLEHFTKTALESSIGAGLVVLAMAIAFVGLLLVFAPRAHAAEVETYIPAGAYKYGPMLKAEQQRGWATHPAPELLFALAEKESCIHLRHPKCWNPAAQLKTAREEGAGMFQITRAYDAAGRLRFDSLEATKALDPELAMWSWDNVYLRPELQFRAAVAMNRDCYQRITPLVHDEQRRLEFCDAAYNGGYGGMQGERRACGQRAGCDPQVWFGNVERVCLKSKEKWKGYGRSACEINRDHVNEVTRVRRLKYATMLVDL